MALKPEDHALLNSARATKSLLDEKRREYADDPIALQHIDGYDGASSYHEKFRQLRDAWLRKDQAEIQELQTWFLEHYPAMEDET